MYCLVFRKGLPDAATAMLHCIRQPGVWTCRSTLFCRHREALCSPCPPWDTKSCCCMTIFGELQFLSQFCIRLVLASSVEHQFITENIAVRQSFLLVNRHVETFLFQNQSYHLVDTQEFVFGSDSWLCCLHRKFKFFHQNHKASVFLLTCCNHSGT